ncbi:MAG: DeoR/GlpR transcriptional regulator [Chloroflexi bacterium]|nr:DeoR/GlpR transcriptional regulator [Chloroflexota bacterium]
MIGAERLRRISERLSAEHVVSIASLSKALGVSEMTIRRDLMQLEKMGLCRRTHGGAVSTHGTLTRDIDYRQREQLHVAEKVAIGRAAAAMVQEGETIAIDAGTTTAQLAAALKGRRNIMVITNSLRVLDQLCDSPGITLISTGGTVAPAMDGEFGHGDHFLVGPLAEATLRRFRPNKAFMGTTGLTITDGLSNSVIEQAELKRLMMELSAEVILLADHSKFGRVASAIAGPVTMLHRVITDSGISPQMKRALEELGIEVIVVEPAKDVLVVPGFVAAQGGC